MMKFDASKFYSVTTLLACTVGIFSTLRWAQSTEGKGAINNPRLDVSAPTSDFKALADHFKELGMDDCAIALIRVNNTMVQYADGKVPMELVERQINEFRSRTHDALKKPYVLILNAWERALYEPNEPLFGETVFQRFAGANDDIAEAGKCLSLERGTSTVFHLMRVMEAGLKALGKELGIPYAPSWESYIRQLDKLLDSSNYDKLTPEQKRKRPFYQDVLGDLVSIKSAWRNPTMHIVRSYDPAQAKIIFDAVKGLMQHLSNELNADPSMVSTP